MPYCFLSLRLGPRIEVYRNQSRPLHVDDGAVHVRRHPAYRNVSVLVRRPAYSSSVFVPRFSPSYARYRSPSPSSRPRREPQIIEIEPSERFRELPPRGEEEMPRQHYHSHFHQQAPVSAPAPPPVPVPPPPEANPLGERVETLAARNAALEAEMRELREQFRTVRLREEIAARVREEVETRPRRGAAECGCGYTGDWCRCGGGGGGGGGNAGGGGGGMRSAMRGRGDGRGYWRDADFESRSPRQRRGSGSVRWVDEVDWD